MVLSSMNIEFYPTFNSHNISITSTKLFSQHQLSTLSQHFISLYCRFLTFSSAVPRVTKKTCGNALRQRKVLIIKFSIEGNEIFITISLRCIHFMRRRQSERNLCGMCACVRVCVCKWIFSIFLVKIKRGLFYGQKKKKESQIVLSFFICCCC